MMPIDESIAHLQLVVGSGLVFVEPGCERPVSMRGGDVERMCVELDASGDHAEAARHRRELEVLEAVAKRIASRSNGDFVEEP